MSSTRIALVLSFAMIAPFLQGCATQDICAGCATQDICAGLETPAYNACDRCVRSVQNSATNPEDCRRDSCAGSETLAYMFCNNCVQGVKAGFLTDEVNLQLEDCRRFTDDCAGTPEYMVQCLGTEFSSKFGF